MMIPFVYVLEEDGSIRRYPALDGRPQGSGTLVMPKGEGVNERFVYALNTAVLCGQTAAQEKIRIALGLRARND